MLVKQLCLANMKVLVKMGDFRDNRKRPTNSPIYQCENVGQMGSFVGQVKTSVNSANLPTFIVQFLIRVVGSACFGLNSGV